jgi:hypothetical protein
MIYAHVSEDAKTQLSDLLFVRWWKNVFNVVLRDNIVKSGYSWFPKKGFDAFIAESDVGESFKQMNEVLPVFLLERPSISWVSDEWLNHTLSTFWGHHSDAAVVIQAEFLEGAGNWFSHLEDFVF